MVIILGLGFTGQQLAWRLLRDGVQTYAAVRNPARFHELADAGLLLSEFTPGSRCIPALPSGAVVVNLIPPLTEPENAGLRAMIEALEPGRVVYISSTGVYGGQVDVDAKTPVQPNDERGRRRVEEERWIAAANWSYLILRAAAIYGPGRGVHTAIREGKLPRSAGSGVVSRIHVDDLAAIVYAAIFSELEGAWPVADNEPCSSAEIIAWCSRLLKREEIPLVAGDITSNITTAGRRVNGREIREKLGIELSYPSWKTGVRASLTVEENGKA